MKMNLLVHIIIRAILGVIPVLLFALIIASDKQSGNSFLGSNFLKMILGFGSLILWCGWITTEIVIFYLDKQKNFANANLYLLLSLSAIYILELYINHRLN